MGGSATHLTQAAEESDLPAELSNPARRALTGAGDTRLEQLTETGEAEVARLHGVGPKAIRQFNSDLRAKRLSFAGPK